MAINTNPTPVPAPAPGPVPRPTVSAPAPVTPGVATGTIVPTPTPIRVDPAAEPVLPGPGTGISPAPASTVSVASIEITPAAVTPSGNISSNVAVTATVVRPGGNNGAIQFNNNSTFGGANSLSYNSVTGTLNVRASVYNNGFGGLTSTAPILFYDRNGNQSGMVNWVQPVSGSSVSGTGVHISPWPNFNGSPTSVRNDAGITVWRGPAGQFYRTVTNINQSQNSPGPHGLNLYDGAFFINSYEPSSNTAGFSQVILNVPYSSGTIQRAVGQISSFAYTSPDQGRMWTLGWKQVSAITPNRATESTPGNINISWNSNNRVSINNATLTESFNVLGNIRIQATGANNNTGIKFADGTFQYTAATSGSGANIAVFDETTLVTANVSTFVFQGNGVSVGQIGDETYVEIDGGSGISGITVQDEGSNVVVSANAINFVGTGVTATNVGNVATVTIPASSLVNTVYNAGFANTVTLNYNNGQWQNYSPNDAVLNVTISNIPTGGEMTVFLRYGSDNTSITWTGNPYPIFWEGGDETPSQTLGQRDVLTVKNNGNYYFASLGKNYV